MKIICFDIDGVICETKGSNYKLSKPHYKVIKIINKLYNSSHYIIIFTSRYMGRNNENVAKAKRQGYDFTKKQLVAWGVKFNKLIFGKPSYDLIIDDKSLFFKNDWFKSFTKK
jgi:histidinol phosphatase-like enzyme